MGLKTSFYNHLFESNNNYFIYNLLSTGIAQLDENTYSALQTNNLQSIDNNTIDALTTEGFLVEDDVDENLCYKYYYDRARFSASADILNIIFIPSYNCNLRCPYCYEGENKTSGKIKLNQIDLILSFIQKQIDKSQNSTPIKMLTTLLYGGEPMMNKVALKKYCAGIIDIVKKNNLKYHFDMASNLTLLDDEIINLIKDYNILVQVSIDGIKEQHDTRRVTATGKGTFDTIVVNLEKLINAGLKKNIMIRANIDSDNLEQAEALFNQMKKYSDDIYFGLLTKYNGFNDGYEKQCINTDCSKALLLDTHKIYKKFNLPIPQKFGKKGPCAINCENKFIVDYALNVYKCDLLVNNPKCRIGVINENGDIEYNSNFYKQMNFSPFNYDKCRNCKFLPICGGGCPAKDFFKTGEISDLKSSCEYNEEKLNACLVDYINNIL
jgi:uncharacterized protein